MEEVARRRPTSIYVDNHCIRSLVREYMVDPKRFPPIGTWDVSRVTNMDYVFNWHSLQFNEELNDWDVSNVTSMISMFNGALLFNQPLDKWKVGKVQNLSYMFQGCFVSNVEKMDGMFECAFSFNQPLGQWNTANVTSMSCMFLSCSKFDQPLNNWNVSKVVNMEKMFYNASNFNQPLSNWNMRQVCSTREMFRCFEFLNSKFQQNLNCWQLESVVALRRTRNGPEYRLQPTETYLTQMFAKSFNPLMYPNPEKVRAYKTLSFCMGMVRIPPELIAIVLQMGFGIDSDESFSIASKFQLIPVPFNKKKVQKLMKRQNKKAGKKVSVV